MFEGLFVKANENIPSMMTWDAFVSSVIGGTTSGLVLACLLGAYAYVAKHCRRRRQIRDLSSLVREGIRQIKQDAVVERDDLNQNAKRASEVKMRATYTEWLRKLQVASDERISDLRDTQRYAFKTFLREQQAFKINDPQYPYFPDPDLSFYKEAVFKPLSALIWLDLKSDEQ